jgi:hypothetical protein
MELSRFWTAATWGVVATAWIGGCATGAPDEGGSNTNWLCPCGDTVVCERGLCPCSSDTECGDLACICGSCTVACADSDDCRVEGKSYTCASSELIASGCTAAGRVCLASSVPDSGSVAPGQDAAGKRDSTARDAGHRANDAGPDARNGVGRDATPEASDSARCELAPPFSCEPEETCLLTWESARAVIPECESPDTLFLGMRPLRKRCGDYDVLALFGLDSGRDYFYAPDGRLVGVNNTGLTVFGCTAYDPSFTEPPPVCEIAAMPQCPDAAPSRDARPGDAGQRDRDATAADAAPAPGRDAGSGDR